MSESGRVIEASGLSLAFGAVTAFADVDFHVDEGELFAVIGPNGAGKTSLFNVLSRVYRPTGGTVTYRGANLLGYRRTQLPSLGIARTFQNLGLFHNMSVLDNVLVGRHHLMRTGSILGGLYVGFAAREEREHRRAAMEVLDFVGIARWAQHPVQVLPYGVQKRVELARALAMEPRVLLLDEPVAGMSSTERAEITQLVRRIHHERGLTIVLVEHDMGMVMQVAERVMVLDFGRVICIGTPAVVQHDAGVIRAYLGEADDATEAAS
ncbi:MAG TPA: ABC transporter ATP-binding protein [Candidatus Dormibacteraeota bacterium]|nr:ABC transporter ATP-binding protein [Candidatus Dormibacteraeota bacterium]